MMDRLKWECFRYLLILDEHLAHRRWDCNLKNPSHIYTNEVSTLERIWKEKLLSCLCTEISPAWIISLQGIQKGSPLCNTSWKLWNTFWERGRINLCQELILQREQFEFLERHGQKGVWNIYYLIKMNLEEVRIEYMPINMFILYSSLKSPEAKTAALLITRPT